MYYDFYFEKVEFEVFLRFLSVDMLLVVGYTMWDLEESFWGWRNSSELFVRIQLVIKVVYLNEVMESENIK